MAGRGGVDAAIDVVMAKRRLVATAVVVLVALTAIAFLALGGNGPADPSLAGAGDRRPLAGFGETAFRVVDAAGSTFDGCALLADTDPARARGMMEQTDLRGYDAMVFANPTPVTTGFYNRNVPVPLTVAWFDAAGGFVGSAEMPPCPDQDGCPTYDPPAPWQTAIEVLSGGASRLGIATGARLTVGGPCPATPA